jgi:hypothetical protein
MQNSIISSFLLSLVAFGSTLVAPLNGLVANSALSDRPQPLVTAPSSSAFSTTTFPPTQLARSVAPKSVNINTTHIFHGEINRRGAAVGYHHRANGRDKTNARMIKIISHPNRQGIYVGQVEIKNPQTGQWVRKSGISSFFPDRWTQGQVTSEIQGAFFSLNPPTERWQATSPSGIRIEGFYNRATNTINTAYPIYRR